LRNFIEKYADLANTVVVIVCYFFVPVYLAYNDKFKIALIYCLSFISIAIYMVSIAIIKAAERLNLTINFYGEKKYEK